MWKWIKYNIRIIIMILIFVSCFALIGWVILLFLCVCWITKEQIVTWILIPMICALIWASITIAMDNSLSNERLKISLNRLERWWKNHSEIIWDKKWSKDNSENINEFRGEQSKAFDYEYRFITKNRWKSKKEIIKEMKKSNYFENKYNLDAYKELWHNDNITDWYCLDWIDDHFLY